MGAKGTSNRGGMKDESGCKWTLNGVSGHNM